MMNKENDLVVKQSFCNWCKGECGVLIYLQGDKLLKIEEDPAWPRKVWPSIKGCIRRLAAVEWFYHPKRLNYPLKRAGARGSGQWKHISWDDALDEISARLADIKSKYGAEAVATTRGTLRTHEEYRTRFMNLFGSPNRIGQARICMGPRSVMGNIIAGKFSNFAIKPSTKCIVLLGVDPLVSRPWVAKTLKDAKARGAQIITIDPRRTPAASMADLWIPLRPGTDAALLLGMINTVIEEGIYDKDFVDQWCYGFKALKERVKEYTPAVVAQITGVAPEIIVEAARIYAYNRPGTFIEGMGVEHAYNATQALHARWILAGLAGNIDVEGGEEQASGHDIVTAREIELADALPAGQWSKMLGADRFRLFSEQAEKMVIKNQTRVFGKASGTWACTGQGYAPSVYRAAITGKPYPVKAFITQAGNPMVTHPNTKLVYQVLMASDLYVVMDYFPTPSTAIADYVLPAASWLERPELWTFFDYSPHLFIRPAAVPNIIPGRYEHYRDFDLWRGLGMRLGQQEYWPWQTLEEAFNDRLKPLGFALETAPMVYTKKQQYQKYKKSGFATNTGKIEFYSTVLENLGYDPLPKYVEPKETPVGSPELNAEYPYMLITGGRSREYYHSEWRQVDTVRRCHPDPLVEIHPDTAAQHGIKEGDWVYIETLRGRIRQKAKLFADMDPGIVHAEHGWWLPEAPEADPSLYGVWEVNVNVLTTDEPEYCNPEIGVWPLRTALCKIYKVVE